MTFPPREVRRWQPPPPPRRPARRQIRWWERPGIWWGRHAWIPLWIAVFLTPAALLSLRVIDDRGVALLVPTLLMVMILFLLLVLIVFVRTTASRSMFRALAGGGSAVLATILLALPMIHVIGQRQCPEWMGPDRGVETSLQVLEAWRRGEAPPRELWVTPSGVDEWKPRAERSTLLDYKLLDSGCWERMAPVASKKTWHEFRVTVQKGDGDPFSKMLTVHTSATRDGWRISEIDGPDPS
ncbi:MAG TPA: hypothetical protein VGT02_02325 [Methylomirabilota bacterium]|nr:hypothetical protein [Methylomirabilota bacterium]